VIKNTRGQSTIEFMLSLTLMAGMVMFCFRVAMFLAAANYIQYAVFMSSRALLSAGKSPDEQSERAQKVIQSTLKRGAKDRFAGILEGAGVGAVKGLTINTTWEDAPNKRELSWRQGVRYSMRGTFFGVDSMLPENAKSIRPEYA
jgi:Flp pilus assembly protein TadG